jgi:hypothetical protein
MLTRLSGPRSRPTATQKIWQHQESNPGPLGLQLGSLTTRPQRRSYFGYTEEKVLGLEQQLVTVHITSKSSSMK